VTHAVETDELLNVLEELGATTEAMESIASGARHATARLHDGWQGAAASAHLDEHTRWQQDLDRMTEALARLRRIIGTAHDNYSAAIAANRRMWS
jgi:WXG100 family type VII secretion target